MTNKNGGIIDDLIVYKLDNEKYMLVVNASNIEKTGNGLSNTTKSSKMKFQIYLINIANCSSGSKII